MQNVGGPRKKRQGARGRNGRGGGKVGGGGVRGRGREERGRGRGVGTMRKGKGVSKQIWCVPSRVEICQSLVTLRQ